MGRTKTKEKRKDRSIIVGSDNFSTKATSGPSSLALFEKAQTLVEQCDYELAAKFLQRILDIDAVHVQARELLGVVSLELGDLSNAQKLFESLVNSNPNAPIVSSAHLHLAQLSNDPREALDHYQKAVDILYDGLKSKEQTVSEPENSEDTQGRQTIAKALVAMTEIWLSDLCMEEEAESTCERLLDLAIQADPHNPEVLQSLASVRMSQQRPEEAKGYVERAWAIWKDNPKDDKKVPLTPVQLSLARLFLELAMYNEAMTVLNGVIETDDQEVEAWYLEGWCFLLTSEDAKSRDVDVDGLSWKELAQDARDCLETCISLFQSQQHPDQQMLAHAQELMQQLATMGITGPRVDTEEGEEAEAWEDVESGDEEDEEMET